MNKIILILLCVIFGNLPTVYCQGLNCFYRNDPERIIYTCYLQINNPNGFNNFTTISGTHLGGTDDSVSNIEIYFPSISANVPSIICNKFRYVRSLYIDDIKIERVDQNVFNSCKSLISLKLDGNKISTLPDTIFDSLVYLENLSIGYNNLTKISSEWFKKLQNLKLLYLDGNKIEDVPKNAFNSLKKLAQIYINYNNLKIINSDSFGTLPYLIQIYLSDNQIDAIDEKLIDFTAVNTIDMSRNLCANEEISDNSVSRQTMRTFLRKCFNNYENLTQTTTTAIPTTFPTTTIPLTFTTTTEETTTRQTLPPGCITGNLDERVCRIEGKNEELEDHIEDLISQNRKLEESMEEQFDNFGKEKDEMRAAIEDLHYQILELSSRPCACL